MKKINCAEVKYLMPLYESGELDSSTMVAFELHLQQCFNCASEVEQSRAVDNLLRDAFAKQELNVSTLRERILERLPSAKPKREFLIKQLFDLRAVVALLLLLVSGTVVAVLLLRSTETVYASAVEDHTQEVVERAPIRGWRQTPAEIEQLGLRELGDTDFKKIELPPYRLTKARVCNLSGKRYMHLVYENEGEEISVFIRRKDGELPGAIREIANGCGLHSETTGKYEVAGFQSSKFTVLIVSSLSEMESLRLAREVAMRLV